MIFVTKSLDIENQVVDHKICSQGEAVSWVKTFQFRHGSVSNDSCKWISKCRIKRTTSFKIRQLPIHNLFYCLN
uniref:Uncharacterized protein n=1 Tax=Anguilla anguilla TaxID=7936 RepID=A0A0E9VQ55_ANGAN